MKKFFYFLKEYIKMKIKGITLFVAFVSVSVWVIALHKVNTEAVLYAAEICAYIGAIYFFIDFIIQYHRFSQLKNMNKQVLLSLGALPKPKTVFEKEYQALLRLLFSDRNDVIFAADEKRREMIDYYVLWAHQIKTPIAGMKLHLQRIKTQENTDLLLELFQVEQYVEMVMNYLRVEQMTSDIVLNTQNLDDIVKQAIRKYGKVFVNKKIQLDLRPCDCSVMTDEKWLLFVIEQILSNALKYTNVGKISIYVENEKTLVIADTGIGIKQSDLPRIFEKGFTGYNGRYDKSASGIGLYLCKRILSNLSHSIEIKSEIDKGTEVKITMDMATLNVE